MKYDPGAEDRVLRAKYLDWCSAKVADRFLELTPDQIYDLAHPTSPGETGRRHEAAAGDRAAEPTIAVERVSSSAASSFPAGPLPALSQVQTEGEPEAGLVFRALVERVTEALAARLELPTFQEWAAAYRAAPDRYEQELLGLWSGDL